MKKSSFTIVGFLTILGCTAQVPTDRAHCQNPDFDKKVANWINFSVKTISPSQAKALDSAIFFDARERNEFDVSHLPNAIFVGYKNFDAQQLAAFDKNKPIVVYCSIGYRSEKIGEKLLKLGFKNVFNLYGSLFEWVNQGYEVVDTKGAKTQCVHTFNKSWSRWVDNKNID
ncbi:MAG: rhodanese-like domain-containing protein [Saprospiraceae bacterium]|nr:rhodanese-like domain-containing protein [Saprospiraceae bacterium]